MKNIWTVVVLSLAAVMTPLHAETEAQMLSAAKAGDYQARRNLAYSYASGWGKPGAAGHVPKKPVDACAWYRVVVLSSAPQLNGSDYSNEWTYCRVLSLEENELAWKLVKGLAKRGKND